eukprot:TRINITY_DN10718_c0_g1_i1.p1 TRINITY_DN10718_c0_g1~~TRINITY_DN10718_c0_g1_i1.p1  ORF type:complete len:259 (+),score=59.90 TRINITY_DN10718_c0_g1_i1:61-777(+)
MCIRDRYQRRVHGESKIRSFAIDFESEMDPRTKMEEEETKEEPPRARDQASGGPSGRWISIGTMNSLGGFATGRMDSTRDRASPRAAEMPLRRPADRRDMENESPGQSLSPEKAGTAPGNNEQLFSFFNHYTRYTNDVADVMLDMDKVHSKLSQAIRMLHPPPNATPRTTELWASLNDMDKRSIEEMAGALGKLSDPRLFEMIQSLEALNFKLMVEFSTELTRGKNLGLLKDDNFQKD